MHGSVVVAVTGILTAIVGSVPGPSAGEAVAAGDYAWPVLGRVLRGFEPAATPYGPGHRGIDIGAERGTRVRAAERGVVAFAGRIAGQRFISILHPGGIRTTYSWLSRVDVAEGQTVLRGAVIGRTGDGHPGSDAPHLHFGAKIDDVYLDPLTLLEPVSLVGIVRLAPLGGAWARSPP
ncbi:MAG TPA: M23 family metallopeptidase [Actinomycetota bacterium]